MDQSQRSGVESTHPEYDAARPMWQRCRDVYAGSDAVKARGEEYLPKVSPKQNTESYASYILRALFFPAMQKTVFGVAGTVLRAAEEIKWTSKAQKTRYEADLTNVDGTGATLGRWLFASLRDDVLVTGRHIWALDWSTPLNRPIWRAYPAESMTMWRVGKVGGSDAITMAVFSEMEPTSEAIAGKTPVFDVEERRIYRVLWLDQSGASPIAWSQKYVETKTLVPTGDKQQPDRVELKFEADPDSLKPFLKAGKPIPFLPVIVVGALGVTPEVTEAPFKDLVDVNLSHYRSSADLEWGRHFTALPTPYVIGVPSGTTELTIGSGSAWILEGPGATAGMLEYTGQGLGALETALSDKEAKMAALGARPFESARPNVETAEAIRLRQAGDLVTLDTLSRALSEAATIMLSWHLWWKSADGIEIMPGGIVKTGVAVELSREFADAAMSSDELRVWVESYQNEAISFETFYARLVAAKLARPGVNAEDELALIRAGVDALPKILPVNGNIPPTPPVNDDDDDDDEDDDAKKGDDEGDEDAED